MQSERWQQLEQIVQSAIDCAPGNRSALLDSACGEDAELRCEVESLLVLHEDSGFTSSSAFEDGIKALEQRNGKLNEGRRLGAYRVLREIGRGGMGTVYLAARADDAFQKLVAIKIIRRGLDSDDIIERFRNERRILATLDHPNITRLLDGGTTDDGLPYFVMEYIEGEAIDVYCDERKLTITERLKLFQGVCAALRYAHQNLVIHRDIKPGNVLVTREGVPRLLDFGIAKLLTPVGAMERTLTGLRPLTPDYASPEQLRGEALTTASDVYSMGVLLYLLLTGHRPYREATSSSAVIQRAICEEEPEKPSLIVMREESGPHGNDARITPNSVSRTREGTPDRLQRRLEGDLDNIVLMALRKQPHRRYTSAEQLSDDINRHLGNLPVIARSDTRGYRMAKFVQRHKTWVALAATIFLTLTGGIAATLWQAHVARQQRDLARLEQAKSARINAFLQEMVGYSNTAPSSPNRNKGHDATVADMLDDAAQRVETELADQPEVKAEMLGTIGGTYESQAKYDLAQRYLREAYDLNVKLYGPDSRQTAAIMYSLADLCYLTGDYTGADSWFRKALPIFRIHAKDIETRILVGMLSDAAFVSRATGRLDEAEALWREALTYGPRLPPKYRGQAIGPKSFLAQLYIDRGDVEQADTLASEASQQLRAFGGDRFSLAQSLIDLGNIRRLEARYSEADVSIQEGTNLYAQSQGEDHPNVAFGLTTLAMSHYDQHEYDLAERDARRALTIVEKLPKGHYYAGVHVALGLILNKTGRSREAEALLREGLAIREQKSPRRSNYVASALGSLGECLMTQKRYGEAESLLIESYQTLKSLHVPRSPAVKEAHERLVSLYTAWGKPAESIRYMP